MIKKNYNNFDDALVDLKNLENRIVKLSDLMISADNGNIFPVDLIAIGAMKRTISNLKGFLLLVENKNMISARSLLRVQIDTFMRFSTIWLVESPHQFAEKIITGEHIRNIRDKTGNKMTDYYLVDILSKRYPWIKEVYRNLSGYIHFSSNHLFNAVEKVDNKNNILSFFIGVRDENYSEESWIEIIECFLESVNILFSYIEGWTLTKNETSKNRLD